MCYFEPSTEASRKVIKFSPFEPFVKDLMTISNNNGRNQYIWPNILL